jgi:2-dehydro-3-deoxygluconokinase
VNAAGTGRRGLLTFGESMGLISTHVIGSLDMARDAVIGIGGAESNVAIGVARLGQPATWIGRVGRDATGDLIQRRLRAEGIDTRAIPDDSFTGLMIRYRRTGDVTIVDYHRQGSAGSRLRPGDIPGPVLDRSAILHVTGITPALGALPAAAVSQALTAARAAGVTVSLDVNYRRKLWSPAAARAALAPLAAQADIVFAGLGEARLLLGVTSADPAVLAGKLTALGPAEVLVKQGEQGCTAVIDGVTRRQPGLPATVVDPVGAGDAFVAGYVASRLGGADPAQRLRVAAAAGAYAVSVPGDCELLPTSAELEQMLTTTDILR